MNMLVQYVSLFRNTQISISHSLFFIPLSDFSMKCSVIILPQFSMQPIIIAALSHLFCQSERNGEGQLTPNTHPSAATPTPSQTYTHTSTNTQINTRTLARPKATDNPGVQTHICG